MDQPGKVANPARGQLNREMDQLICASLSHTHYWYEVGMLKVSAVLCPSDKVRSTLFFMMIQVQCSALLLVNHSINFA